MKKQNIWIAFLLKDKYSTDNEKEKLKYDVIKKFKRNKNDIYYFSSCQKSGLSYYFFIKEENENDLRNIFDSYNPFLLPYSYHVKIKEYELKQMMKNIDIKEKDEIAKFGDFVMINKGKYNKLYGVVLRQNRLGKVQVGLNFCFGPIIQVYEYKDLTPKGNIFNYIKVLK